MKTIKYCYNKYHQVLVNDVVVFYVNISVLVEIITNEYVIKC